MTRHGRIALCTLVALGLAVAGCRCSDRLDAVGPPRLLPEPSALVFDQTYVGAVRRASLTISNLGDSQGTALLQVAPPFSITPRELTLGKGESITATVEFAPLTVGTFTESVLVGAQPLAIEGLGIAPLQCMDPGVCRASTFDPATGQCERRDLPAGTACETRCTQGACVGEACVGTAKDCDDRDACTVDACSEADGCLHTPRTCAPPTNPCLAARCDPQLGCVTEEVQAGTLCGPDTCALQDVSVCLGGVCTSRPRPPSGRCANRWVPLSLPRSNRAGMAFDQARAKTVFFTDTGNTWELDGRGWTQRFPASSPTAGIEIHLAYDPVRRRVLLVGQTATALETWAFDGSTWLRERPPVSPSPRHEFALATDPVRRRIVLHGGSLFPGIPSRALRDTWEWDGLTWREALPTGPTPEGRVYASLAFDQTARELVLFGGLTATGHSIETWLWNGTSWRLAASGGPRGRNLGSMAEGPARRPLLFGGHDGSLLDDLWEWRGAQWVLLSGGATRPSARSGHGAAYDSARGVMVTAGGIANGSAETWEWDGMVWRTRTAVAPRATAGGSLAYDQRRARVVFYGGTLPAGVSDETWEWDGVSWGHVQVTSRPPPIIRPAMAYDALRARIVLLGTTGDVYEYDGVTWTAPRPSLSPPATNSPALAWNPQRQRVVTVERAGSSWEWDGTAWTPGSAGLPPRLRASLVEFTQGTVAFGGENSSTGDFLDDTWEWTGSAWIDRTPVLRPPGRHLHVMAYDSTRRVVLLFGGQGSVGTNGFFDDTWEWDGAAWTQRSPIDRPKIGDHALAYDRARQRMVLLTHGDTWFFLP